MKLCSLRLSLYFSLTALIVGMSAMSGCGPVNNRAPVIVSFETEKNLLSALETTDLRVVAYDPDGGELSYEWLADGGTIVVEGDRATWTAPHVSTDSTNTIIVKVKDNREAELEEQLDIDVTPNMVPVIDSLTASQTQANPGDFVIIDCMANDAGQDSLNYAWSATKGSFSRSGPVVIWQAPDTPGSIIITVVVDDSKGGKASADIAIELVTDMPNQPPVIQSLTSDDLVVVYGNSTTVTCYAFDHDADDLTYIWSADEGSITGEGAFIEWSAPEVCGHTVPIRVTVLDGHGGEASAEIEIETRIRGCGGA